MTIDSMSKISCCGEILTCLNDQTSNPCITNLILSLLSCSAQYYQMEIRLYDIIKRKWNVMTVYIYFFIIFRGICYFFLEVECASKDLHSGLFGGTV